MHHDEFIMFLCLLLLLLALHVQSSLLFDPGCNTPSQTTQYLWYSKYITENSNLCSIIILLRIENWILHWLAYISNWLYKIRFRFTLILSFHCWFYFVTVTWFISNISIAYSAKDWRTSRKKKVRVNWDNS